MNRSPSTCFMTSAEAIRRLRSSTARLRRGRSARAARRSGRRLPPPAWSRWRPLAISTRSSGIWGGIWGGTWGGSWGGAAAAGAGAAPSSIQRPRYSTTSTPQIATSDRSDGSIAARISPMKSRSSPWAMIMFCGLPMMVPADPELAANAKPSRKGVALRRRARQSCTSRGNHGDHDDVVGQDRRQHARGDDHQGEQLCGPEFESGGTRGEPAIEAGNGERARHDHQAEQQRHGRKAHRRPGGVHVDLLEHQHGDGAEQGRARAVDAKAGESSQRHRDVGREKIATVRAMAPAARTGRPSFLRSLVVGPADLVQVDGGLRHLQLRPLHRRADDLRHREIPEPLVVGRDDVPRSPVRRAAVQWGASRDRPRPRRPSRVGRLLRLCPWRSPPLSMFAVRHRRPRARAAMFVPSYLLE